jgi:hypothetical protein
MLIITTILRDMKNSDTANYNEKFIVSSGIRSRIFRFLDCRYTHWAIESTGIGSESNLSSLNIFATT